MKSPRSDASKSVRVTSENIQRELSQLITHLEGTTRGVDDARFRKIAMKSAEVLKGLRTLFERLGSEDQAASAKRPEAPARETKSGAKPSANGKESAQKTNPPSVPAGKSNGSAPVALSRSKTPAPVAKPGSAKADAGTNKLASKPATPPAASESATAPKLDPMAPVAKPEDPAEIAAKARLQKLEARAPKRPGGHAAPRPLPPQSGKPIWSKPHSS